MTQGHGSLNYEINSQVLELVCQVARQDLLTAQIMFGLPKELANELRTLDSKQIKRLSQTQGCLLTLRNCADDNYWKNILSSCQRDSEEYMLNLQALSMIRVVNNKQLEVSDQQETSRSFDNMEVSHVAIAQ